MFLATFIQNPPDFTIENNVLIGPITTSTFKDYNIGNLVMNSLDVEPDHIWQVQWNSVIKKTFITPVQRYNIFDV